ncbi:pyruvate kinase [Buchnera aphidicola str. Bp (Baizongia pistaciae)]|uniref:Pyruvate kinase n=1 Tax=Buchnera aphidicola subsp. Baizongia pistaciae (strain Bp) TaxID=224915 RepID=KPYK_BUCBP|nr:pyruvate kinase [Buchnera aphidicola]Q89AI8.1 RecName: Full=Pyruvate kinase; Short=PK [Buchnera aphidicola str. Bp (Baizongia pistaciae)]AAO27022.1 pyruvate kinase [Buchnera aphidicola str. Bp (Baizongia pistaciae)]
MIRRFRRTKIVATLGPSTDNHIILENMIKSGVNVFRLNFSHGTREEHIYRAKLVTSIAKRLNCHIALLGDLQGPKIRICKFQDKKVFLKVNNYFILDANLNENLGTSERVGIDYKNLPKDVKKCDILLLDDGKIQLKVINIVDQEIFTKIIIGGVLSNNKGINKLGGGLSARILTKKDKRDIITSIDIGVDYLAVSFPRYGSDLDHARKCAVKFGSKAKIIAKIERAEAVKDLKIIDEIILASDAIMVARGDLGVEIGESELAGIQKTLIRRARQLNRVVITATQMMESMINNPMPTRAEVMDVANAVLDGSDAVMLSAETASGKYPIETIKVMSKVCMGAEKMPSINVSQHRIHDKFHDIEEAIAMSAMYAANHLSGITAIITMTESGKTSLMTSRITSGLPIFALSSHIQTLKLTALYRGVTPIFFNSSKEGVSAANEVINLLVKRGFLEPGNLVIITQGDIMGKVGKTNTSRILKV